MTELRVNGERLWQSLMTMAEIGATAKGGVNRQTLTDDDKRGRDLFRQWCTDAGLHVSVDRMGSGCGIRRQRIRADGVTCDSPHRRAMCQLSSQRRCGASPGGGGCAGVCDAAPYGA